MLLSLLILLPLVFGLGLTLVKHNKTLGFVGTAVSIYLFIFSLFLLFTDNPIGYEKTYPWFNFGGVDAYISLSIKGLGGTMVLLTSFVYMVLFIYFSNIKKAYSNTFYGLL